MSDEEWVGVLKLPLRLKTTIQQLVSQQAPGEESSNDEGMASFGAMHDNEGMNVGMNNQSLLHSNNDTAPSAALDSNVVSDSKDDARWSLDLPIEQRICPPLRRFGHRRADMPNASNRSKPTKYALSKEELTPVLQEEISALHRFGTEKFFGAQMDPIAAVTADKYTDHLRGMLGWLHRVKAISLDSLSLSMCVPSDQRDGVVHAFEYIQWLHKERSISVRTELLCLRSILYAAKFLYHDTSNILPGSGDKSYSDILVVKELRAMITATRKSSKVAARVSDETVKWLDWPEYLSIVQELKKECALLNEDGSERSRKDVASSLQRYLIFAILASIPDRQRTLRELEVNRTLYKESDGRWVIRHTAEDYKTGKAYGERPPMVLASSLYHELEAFIFVWRSELQPKDHNRVFTQINGQPYTDKQMYKMFWQTSYRITGKRMTPHMVRDSVVTHLRRADTSEKELESLAMLMGHSLDMQRSSYDRRTKEEKVEPAVALLESVNSQVQQQSMI